MKPITVLTKTNTALILGGSVLIPTLVWGNTIEDTHRFRLGIYEQDIDVNGTVTKDPLPEINLDTYLLAVSYSFVRDTKKEFEIDLYGPSIYLTYGF